MAENPKGGAKKGGAKKGAGSETRRGGMRPLGGVAQPLARKALGKRGQAMAAFMADWPGVVGEETAAHCLPQRLSFPDRERTREGTLTLRVANQAWATELEHMGPLLLEKINVYFGYTAVARLRFTSGPLPERKASAPPPPARPLSAEARSALEERLSGIADPDLREAMRRLGERLLARE